MTELTESGYNALLEFETILRNINSYSKTELVVKLENIKHILADCVLRLDGLEALRRL